MLRTFGCAVLLITILQGPAAAIQQSATPDSVVEARRSDLVLFRREFFARDNSYAPVARAAAERRLSRLEAAPGSLSAVRFDLELAQIVALADNGHTALFASSRAARYNRIPLRLVPLDGGFYVLRAAPEHRELLGGRLVAVDGHPVAQAIDSARTLVGGTPAFRDRSTAYFLESPEQMHALGVTASPQSARYRFEGSQGRSIERDLQGEPPGAGRDNSGSSRMLFPEPLQGEAVDWVSILPSNRAPWAFRDLGTPFRWRALPELDAIVVEFRRNFDAPGNPIREFTAAIRDTIRARKPTHLVVDMRANGGGDLNTTRAFFKLLPRLVPGRIFVLTGPWTFSAGISSVGYLKQEAPDRVTIVGEEVGDRLEFWAEGSVVLLPGTGNRVLYATERHDYRTGCEGFTDCHGSVVRNPIAVPTLAPDISAPLTLDAYRAGRDSGLEAVATALGRPISDRE